MGSIGEAKHYYFTFIYQMLITRFPPQTSPALSSLDSLEAETDSCAERLLGAEVKVKCGAQEAPNFLFRWKHFSLFRWFEFNSEFATFLGQHFVESMFLLAGGGRSFEAKLFGPILVRQRSEDVREEDGEWKNNMETCYKKASQMHVAPWIAVHCRQYAPDVVSDADIKGCL